MHLFVARTLDAGEAASSRPGMGRRAGALALAFGLAAGVAALALLPAEAAAAAWLAGSLGALGGGVGGYALARSRAREAESLFEEMSRESPEARLVERADGGVLF